MPAIAVIDGGTGQLPSTSGQRNSAAPAISFADILNRKQTQFEAIPRSGAEPLRPEAKSARPTAEPTSPGRQAAGAAAERERAAADKSRGESEVAEERIAADRRSSAEAEKGREGERDEAQREEADRTEAARREAALTEAARERDAGAGNSDKGSDGAGDGEAAEKAKVSEEKVAFAAGFTGATNGDAAASAKAQAVGRPGVAGTEGAAEAKARLASILGTGDSVGRLDGAAVAEGELKAGFLGADGESRRSGRQGAGERDGAKNSAKRVAGGEESAAAEKDRPLRHGSEENRQAGQGAAERAGGGRPAQSGGSGSVSRDAAAGSRDTALAREQLAGEQAAGEEGRKSPASRTEGEETGKLKVVDLRAPKKGRASGQEGQGSQSDSRGGNSQGSLTLKEGGELSGGENRAVGQSQDAESAFGRQFISSLESRGESGAPRVAQQQQLHRFLRESGYGEIVRNARMMLRENGSGEIRLNLSPKELGSVRVQLQLQDSHIAGRIIVENSTVREVFEQNLDQLQRAFQSQGLETGRLEVSVQERGDGDRREGRGKRGGGGDGAKIFEEHTARVPEYFYGDTQVNLMA